MIEKRVVLVTGASRGIGRAIALRLAEDGCFVIINYRGAKEKAEEVKAEIENRGGEAMLYPCDVADFEACGAMFQDVIQTTGRIDVLVNNAGIVKDGLLMAMKEEDFSKVVDVNLKGTFHCIRHAARQMIRQRSGRIVNMASVVGIQGNAGQANYAASKAGIIGLTKAAARELAGRGITVNAVAPLRKSQGGSYGAYPSGKLWTAGGCGRSSRLSGLGKSRLYHRPGAFRGRRHGNVRE